MKVIANPSALSASGWLEEGEVFTVLAVNFTSKEGVKFLLWSTLQETVALFPAADFTVVDRALSKRWMFGLSSFGDVYLAPDAWQANEFWERYHDGESVAESIFMSEMAMILTE